MEILFYGTPLKALHAYLFSFSLELSQLILCKRQEIVIIFWVLLPAHGLQQPREHDDIMLS